MWLALYVPGLPLQAFSRELARSAPVVVFDRFGRRDVVIARNRVAAALGIKLHCTLAEAHALSAALIALPRAAERERATLHRLADALATLTPNIHVSADFGLLLDVAASLTLHGGAEALLQHAIKRIEAHPLRVHCVLAPTARGARWLATAHRQLCVPGRIDEWLDDLPLACMDIPRSLIAELRELNLHHLAAVRRLDPAELNQRFGVELTNALDQAYGVVTESLCFRDASPRFHEYVEFLDLAREQAHWWPGAVILLRQLHEFLRLHVRHARALQLKFSNGQQQSTELTLVSAHGSHHVNEWLRLLEVRLERQPITHELSRIDLVCTELDHAEVHEFDFFDHGKTHQLIWQSLLDLMSSRLGQAHIVIRPRYPHNAVPESQSMADTVRAVASDAYHASTSALRPPWLVDPPRPLNATALQRLRHAFNRRQPERIVFAWNGCYGDTSAVCRDYYIAAADHHSYWWIFRDRRTDRWFLHGIFA